MMPLTGYGQCLKYLATTGMIQRQCHIFRCYRTGHNFFMTMVSGEIGCSHLLQKHRNQKSAYFTIVIFLTVLTSLTRLPYINKSSNVKTLVICSVLAFPAISSADITTILSALSVLVSLR